MRMGSGLWLVWVDGIMMPIRTSGGRTGVGTSTVVFNSRGRRSDDEAGLGGRRVRGPRADFERNERRVVGRRAIVSVLRWY